MRRRILIIISVLAGIAAFIAVYNPIVSTILESNQHTLQGKTAKRSPIASQLPSLYALDRAQEQDRE